MYKQEYICIIFKKYIYILLSLPASLPLYVNTRMIYRYLYINFTPIDVSLLYIVFEYLYVFSCQYISIHVL